MDRSPATSTLASMASQVDPLGFEESTQLDLFGGQAEDPRYLSEQLLTYIGNKRALLGPIARSC